MKPLYPTPRDLVEALQSSAPGARAQLWEWLREPMARLLDGLIAKHQLRHGRERLVLHALHSAETFLRTRPLGEFVNINRDAFRGALLLQLAKLHYHPFGDQAGTQFQGNATTLPETSGYASQALSLPYDRVGNFWYGGDWFAGRETSDGSLWVLLADITGHGYYAYLLASCLPSVWQVCWQRRQNFGSEPADLLADMHDLLEVCLPEGIYVECTLARLTLVGVLTVAPAGGSRLLLRRCGSGCLEFLKLRGSWLGLTRPTVHDQRTWQLDVGDELLLGTDGVFDHLADLSGGSVAAAVADLPQLTERQSLLEQVHERLRLALRTHAQKDDITMVCLRRRTPTAALPFPEASSRTGADDVSV